MQNLREMLDGHKTYIICLIAGVLWLGTVFQIWTMEQVKELLTLLGILGVAAVRSAINKV